MSFGFCFSVYL